MRPATLILLATFVVTISGKCNEQLNLMNKNLESSDVTIRRSTAKALAIKNPEEMGNEVFVLLQKALKDPDLAVRRYGSAAIFRTVFASASPPKFKNESQVKIDLKSDPTLRQSLLDSLTSALADEDVVVQENVIQTLATDFPLTSQIGAALLRLYNEGKSSKSRSVIIGYFVKEESPEAANIVLKGLGDADGEVRGWAADALAKLQNLPDQGLKKLTDGIGTERDPFVKQKYITAIAAYRKKAIPHLPILETTMKGETNETTKIILENAIRQIQNSSN